MREFTLRAIVVGLPMTIILGAANAYLGLKAGMTIAATYPAAVISMAILRLMKGSILEENLARTAGSIGESVAAGAVFTLPAFLFAKVWPSFSVEDAYWKSTALMLVGSILGVLFVSLVRRVMVEDPELVFPESVAAAEIHKAGQRGIGAAKHLFINMGTGAGIWIVGKLKIFSMDDNSFFLRIGQLGKSIVRLGGTESKNTIAAGGVTMFAPPAISPAYLGVGYIIGPELAALNFAGGVIAWGLLVPLLIFVLGPNLPGGITAASSDGDWGGMITSIWKYMVRPIAVGGMLVGAAYTLYRMRKNLFGGLSRAFAELGGKIKREGTASRTEQYMSSKVVFALIGLMFIVMAGLYIYLSGLVGGGIAAAVVMLIAGFFFATVSGYLVGMIGSSNNPISGLTLSTLIIAALLMVSLGVSGTSGVLAVLGVASVVCVSSAVAGELLQDFKVGYILGGTPRYIQIVELIAVVVASLVMFFPVMLLHKADIASNGTGLGGAGLPAPQAGLMAALAQGIVGGEMAWPLVVVGIFMGIGMILLKVRSPMLMAVGMYLPLETTFAIFVGGVIRGIVNYVRAKKGLNEAQGARVENCGVLIASGLIAGEALMGLIWAGFILLNPGKPPEYPIFESSIPAYMLGMIPLALMAYILVKVPINNAGSPDEPAPPTAMM
ncbi:MAG: oligopeptide transporter, OPT family [Planctomycetes bacterium]|nr:oligopeptide transporter, OPT family [Planctomycetota bacterium]MBI3846995.1 oligopeptide transporter, OPT family [Planctomycetota bacterium]